ncbi:Histone-lysine N-methyltransferase ATXR3 [Linum grandiflorum]
MGDGGVACMPFQQHSNSIIMERFPVQENNAGTTHCTGVNNTTATTTTATSSTSTSTSTPISDSTATLVTDENKLVSNGTMTPAGTSDEKGAVAAAATTTTATLTTVSNGKTTTRTASSSNGVTTKPKKILRKIITVKKVIRRVPVSELRKKKEAESIKAAAAAAEMTKSTGVDGMSGQVSNESLGIAGKEAENVDKVQNGKEEVEEGELGTLKWPTRIEVEKGEFVFPAEKPQRRSEIEKGEIVGDKWRRGEVEKGQQNVSGKWRPWEFSRDEVEKGEFVPDRWQYSKEEYSYGKSRGKYESSKDRTPPSGRYPGEEAYVRKDGWRGGNSQHVKTSLRWESGQERGIRISSKIVDDEGSNKSAEYSNGKNNHVREHTSSANRLKRHGTDSDNNDRKHHADYGDYAGSKSRRLSDESSRSSNSDHHSRHSVERYVRTPSSARVSSVDKYPTRYHEPTLSSKVVYERQPERSPLDRSRYDHRERSPARHDQSPHGGRERVSHGRDRSSHGREKSPHGRERSPYAREKSPFVRERSQHLPEKSPQERGRLHERRSRTPSYTERSPQDRARHHERRDRTPNRLEKSPLSRDKLNTPKEACRKNGGSEKRNSQHGDKGQEDRLDQRDSNVRDTQLTAKEDQERSSTLISDGLGLKNADCETRKAEKPECPNIDSKDSPSPEGPFLDELQSMEEDMDICDTPPHAPVVADSSTGKWFYLDYFGVERGPAKLSDLKGLVDEGVLVSDHLIKHLDTDRWMTVEKAVSPKESANSSSIVSESITQLVSPPEAPGNVLTDSGDGLSVSHDAEEVPINLVEPQNCPDVYASDLHIDERVKSLVDGVSFIPGRELEAIGEILHTTFSQVQWDEWAKGYSQHEASPCNQRDETSQDLDMNLTEAVEMRSSFIPEKDTGFESSADPADWFSGRWSCKGGDWVRNDDGVDRFSRRKIVLNDGFPLCLMPRSDLEDPRWQRKDDLYHPSHSRKLELPPWAFSSQDEKNESAGANRLNPAKPHIVRGVLGTALPVVRINACVVNDHGSIVSEHKKPRVKDRYTSRSSRMQATTSESRISSSDTDYQSKAVSEQDTRRSRKSPASICRPKDKICTVDDLQLKFGDWYYLDGAGHEQGPFSYSKLQSLADQGTILKHSSVYRKFDRVWVPVSSACRISEANAKGKVKHSGQTDGTMDVIPRDGNSESGKHQNPFHGLHPQFIGYTRGKLHELVMKSFKSREFAAAINEVLDPWISAKQPKKEIDKHINWKTDIDIRAGKRARMQIDGSDEDNYGQEDLSIPKDQSTFEELCGDATFHWDAGKSASFETNIGGWGLLDGHILARMFHVLRSDIKSLAIASLTCKHWRSAVSFYKDISKQIDLSSLGPNCTDMVIRNVVSGYQKEKVNSLVLAGCTKITCGALEEIIRAFPCLSYIDIRGCSQLTDLALQFPHVNWLKSRNPSGLKTSEELNSKVKSYKSISEKPSSSYKTRGLGGDGDDFGELKEYFASVTKRDSASQLFHRSLYKRSKVFDARRSSSIASRDARMRRWGIKKSESSYRRMEGFIALGLKDIMKENTFDFFIPKVAEIEARMDNGYYIGRGLKSVKEDISRMCRDAIKAKNRGAGNMNRIITLFLQLASRLEDNSKFSYEREELMKSWKHDLSAGLSSGYNKNKKQLLTERKYAGRSNGTPSANGSLNYGEYVSDREIKRRLSKLNRKSMDSGSETSDEFDRSSGDGKYYSESTSSDNGSDLEFQSGGRDGNLRAGFFMEEESSYAVVDEREWGARMTKASLVPPVTRKYEVIDRYVTVADEDDVQRKMCVSLPDDYAEKLEAQKSGKEELDMELPEVKDFKPRKQLGDEVIEQEVYGIDPYTHNLILDSMPEEMDRSLEDKHVFIEEVLLQTLNKQVRHFTGAGNTPMIYPLKPVIEEIMKSADEDCNMRTMRMCRCIMKAIDSRPDDKYVAYRKGLGVVCNKDGGFGEEDFVVEFLGEVYPAWKWFEKQDGIRNLQKDSTDPAPEFYNIYLERPKGDADGYDLVVVDAMHKANYASRICHSCRPNCEAKVTAVDGKYQIGIYTVREIQNGEEITFDYNSVTESKEEYEASVCLCGSQVCRGSYLNLTGEGAFQKVLKQWHGVLDRHQLMLEACESNIVSEEDYLDLGRAGLGSCLLGGLPDWVVAYSARLVRFINLERTKLPEEILKHNLEEKKKYSSEICLDVERSDAEVQAEGVYNQRLQNLAVTLDKVRYVMRCIFGDPKKAPPPLERLSPEETVSVLWKGEGSLVEELLQCMAPHMDSDKLNDLKTKIRAHDPSDSANVKKELHKALLWLRDEVRNLPCTYRCRHDAAADLIHIYAYTKCFFRIREYAAFTSPPVHISPLDLGPECAAKLGDGIHEYRKTYGENYCIGQLIFWHVQTNTDPDATLAKATKGCLSLPDVASFYAKPQKLKQQRIYGPKNLKIMLERMDKYAQKPWPRDQIWSFESSPKAFGSPMFDAIVNNTHLDREMLHWLKHRPTVFQAMWDR